MCVCQPAFPLPKTRSIDIAHIVSHPLLLLDASFAARKKFDATCRLADLKPNILIECRTPHTLLALAEAGLGTAVIPSGVRMDRYAVRALRITHKGKPLLDPLAIVWEGRRKLPRYAKKFCELVAAHMRLPRELSFTGVPQVKQRVRVV
jgi:DNA-binding transcriptional LysR family regulator